MNESPAGISGSQKQGAIPQPEPSIDLRCILAPTDFSAAARRGLKLADELAARFESRLRVVHVVEPPSLPEWGYAHIPQREARLRRAAGDKLPLLPVECGIDPARIESSEILGGEAGDEIRKAAGRHAADLIVMASHGLGGLSHAFSGSTTERVIRHAPCPVLTVRERARGGPVPEGAAFELKRILVPTDFSEASKKALPYAAALARKFEAALLLLYVLPAHLPDEVSQIGFVLEEQRLLAEARERLPRFRETELDPRLPVESLVASGGPAHEICRTAETRQADLIILSTHGHSGLKHFLLGSVTEGVVRHAPCPVLVVRERERDFVKR